MIYRSLLLQLDLYGSIDESVRFGWELANRMEADLIGLAACDVAIPPVAFAGGAVIDTEFVAREAADIDERLRTAKERFMTLTRDSTRASWRGQVGDPNHFLAQQARAADLILTGAAGSGEAGSIDIGEAILACGRPVLLMAENKAPLKARKILVGWKDAREARRAVADAMPFLVHADDVLVVAVDEGDRRAASESLADVVRFLLKHGVKVSQQMIETGGRTVGEALVGRALDVGADLLVSGGFGHSRLREWVLGGATRSLLADHRLNRLLSN